MKMPKSRTDYRKERRILLKEVFDKLFIIQGFNDTDLEKIKRQFFINLKQDLDDIIKRVTYGDRYISSEKTFIDSKEDKNETYEKTKN
jgi:hypothetical protein